MECPKCQYVRLSTDTAPVYECPECGIVYAKFDPTLEGKKVALRAKLEAVREIEIKAQHNATVSAQRGSGALGDSPAKHTDETVRPANKLITNCPACAGLVAIGVKACPHCGMAKPSPKPTAASKPFGMTTAVCALLFAALMIAIGTQPTSGSNSGGERQSSKPEMRLAAQQAVQYAGYKCDSISSFQELLTSTGFSLKCNNYNYAYTITDEGGRMVIRLD